MWLLGGVVSPFKGQTYGCALKDIQNKDSDFEAEQRLRPRMRMLSAPQFLLSTLREDWDV